MTINYYRAFLLFGVLLILATSVFAGADLRCYPNPAAAGYEDVAVSFELTGSAPVTIMVYTLDGDLVKTLLSNQIFSQGRHNPGIEWDVTNDNGKQVKPGPYVVIFEAVVEGANEKITDKFVLIVGR